MVRCTAWVGWVRIAVCGTRTNRAWLAPSGLLRSPVPVNGRLLVCCRARRGRTVCDRDPAGVIDIPPVPLMPPIPGIPLIPGNPIKNLLVPVPPRGVQCEPVLSPRRRARALLACAAQPGASWSSPRSVAGRPPRTVVRCTGAARMPESRHAGGTPTECVLQGRRWLPLAARERTLVCGQATAVTVPSAVRRGHLSRNAPRAARGGR